VKSKYWKRTHKYCIEPPHSVKEALAISKRTGIHFLADPADQSTDLVNPPEKVYTKVNSLLFKWLQRENSQEAPKDLLAALLDKHGFVVVSGVLNRTECKEALELAWDWIEAASLSELQRQTVELVTTSPVSSMQVSSGQ
jgi:hypothetical protein